MTQEEAELMKEFLTQDGYDTEIRDDYSGRMYGKQCLTTFAVVTNARPNAHKATAGFRVENMGLDFVYY